jgi:hypothetical protein
MNLQGRRIGDAVFPVAIVAVRRRAILTDTPERSPMFITLLSRFNFLC